MLKVRNLLAPLLKSNPMQVRSTFATSVAPKEEKVKVGKWNINYVKVGTGTHHLLCMPGALGSIWTDFKPQIEGLDGTRFTVVAWDPPGYGKSRPPEREFPTDFYEREADSAFDFMKALKIPQYSLLGWSDGGISSMILAAKYPQAVLKLVVWGSNALILPHELDMYRQRMRQPMIDVYGAELFAKYWADWVKGMEALYDANKGDICTDRLKDIKCPTFILHGEKDPLVDSSHVSLLHTHIVGSRTRLYPDGKHNIHLAYAEDFNTRIQEFLCS